MNQEINGPKTWLQLLHGKIQVIQFCNQVKSSFQYLLHEFHRIIAHKGTQAPQSQTSSLTSKRSPRAGCVCSYVQGHVKSLAEPTPSCPQSNRTGRVPFSPFNLIHKELNKCMQFIIDIVQARLKTLHKIVKIE